MGSFDAGINSTMDTTVRFVGGTQSISVPANETHYVMVVTSRAFTKTSNTAGDTLNVDVGYASSASATGTGITQTSGSPAASTINGGVQNIAAAVSGGQGSPTIVSTVPVSVSGVFLAHRGGSGTTYHVGMIGNKSAAGAGWSTEPAPSV
jgi:hypothetical protein